MSQSLASQFSISIFQFSFHWNALKLLPVNIFLNELDNPSSDMAFENITDTSI